jgi:hypothetical protein
MVPFIKFDKKKKGSAYKICVKKIEESVVKKFMLSEARRRRDEFMNFRLMQKIFSKFYQAVTFLCYFLLVEAKESKYKNKRRSASLPGWLVFICAQAARASSPQRGCASDLQYVLS